MSMTPMDVSHQRFRKVLFGFDANEVETYLELVSAELHGLTKERQILEDENEQLKSHLDEYREREKGLKETMLAAQRVTEEMKSTAQREAELVIARAELSAERLLEEAQKRHGKILLEINELKRHKIQMTMELKNVLQMHLRMLDIKDEADVTRRPMNTIADMAEHHDDDEATDVVEDVRSIF